METCHSWINLVNVQRCLSFKWRIVLLLGARSWLRELMCVSSTLSTQRAETASWSAFRRTRSRNWKPSRRAPGLSWNARYKIIQCLLVTVLDVKCTNVHVDRYVFHCTPWCKFMLICRTVIWSKTKTQAIMIFNLCDWLKWHVAITDLTGVLSLWCWCLLSCFQPAAPRPAHFVSTKNNEPQLLEPIPYEFMA